MNRFAAWMFLGAALAVRADVRMPAVFSEHGVLHADDDVPVWGWADPDEKVHIRLGTAEASTTAGPDGKWMARLNLEKSSSGPFTMTIEGKNRLDIEDVLVGQVWLCSGQSNMEWPLKGRENWEEAVAQSENPQLRYFYVEKNASVTPVDDVKGHWVLSDPKTSPSFSAIAYYFGQALQQQLKTPVGLILSAWGGTPVEAWTSDEGFEPDAELGAGRDKAQQRFNDFEKYLTDYESWQIEAGREDHPVADISSFTGEPSAENGWQPITLPGMLVDQGLPDAGTVWVSRKVKFDPKAVNHSLDMFLGDLRGSIDVYWNGHRVGSGDITAAANLNRYPVHSKYITDEEGILTLRIFNPVGGIGIAPGSMRFRIGNAGGLLMLDGDWWAKTEYACPPLPAGVEPGPVRVPIPRPTQHVAAHLYNGMIYPLVPYAIAGAIWYQGENNTGNAWQYRTSFRLMIEDWRRQWGQGDFPFYYCQLANFGQRQDKPTQSAWAEVRESQTVVLDVPNTGQAVLIDSSDGNLHPNNKKDPGQRLARLALARTYGRPIVDSGPMLESSRIDGNKVMLHFTHTDGGLTTMASHDGSVPAAPLTGFSICGEDQKWQWAQARIEGDNVVVWNDDIAKPVAVRYAWADNPACNLANGAGLPAGPFRTDDFKLSTFSSRY